MDKEQIKRLTERHAFVENNGKILLYVNLLDARERTLKNLCTIMRDVTTSDFKNSIRYLEDARYIRIGHPDGVNCLDSGALDKPVTIDLTHEGIELLMGVKENPAVEV